jgi:hypothetical protein
MDLNNKGNQHYYMYSTIPYNYTIGTYSEALRRL